MGQESRCVDAPETNCRVRRIIEKSWLVLVRPHSKSIHLPRIDFAAHQKAIETQAHIRTFAYVNQSSRAIFQFLPADAKLDRVRPFAGAYLKESSLKIELFLINRPWTTSTERVQSTFEFDKCPDVFTVMDIEVKHVSLIEVSIHDGG